VWKRGSGREEIVREEVKEAVRGSKIEVNEVVREVLKRQRSS
jgi:hypothetical protein